MPHAAPRLNDMLTFGLAGERINAVVAPRPHQHGEIELNLLEGGCACYRFGGTRITVMAGELVVYWAAVPHHIVDIEPGAVLYWITIPLSTVMSWSLQDELMHSMLCGRPVMEQDHARAGLDTMLMRLWLDDLHGNDLNCLSMTLPEVEARLWRLARSTIGRFERSNTPHTPPVSRAEEIAEYMVQHYAEPLRVPELARCVNLHPSYAMQVFRDTFGMSVIEYLTQQRIAAAQRLLAVTERSVTDICFDVGFGSLSRFHGAFLQICGQTPGAYRQTMRAQRRHHPVVGGVVLSPKL